MSDPDPFAIQLNPGKLRSRPKEADTKATARSEAVAEKHGFVERAPKKRRGRPPSPRTGQVHAKVMPEVSREISQEAKRRGVQQGVLIEEAWALYKAERDDLG